MKVLKNIWILMMVAGITLLPLTGLSQLVINPGTSITVQDGGSLFVDNTLTIFSDDNQSGHLCDQNPAGDIEITGNITIERYLTANMWHNCATPVNNNHSNVYTGSDLVFYYDEAIIENDWEFGWVMYQGQLEVMKGYDVYLHSPETVNYTALSSAGLNTGGYSMNVTRTNPANGEIESHKGWNLIGNPYPSPLDWLEESGWDKSSINDAKYIWDHQNDNYTIFIGGDNPLGINGGTRYIPANQGFWVQALANGSVQVNNSARRGLMQNTPGFYKNDRPDYPLLCLRLESEGKSDETVIRFLDAATNGFDPGLDAFAFNGRGGQSPRISTRCNEGKLAINSIPVIGQHMQFDLQTSFESNTVCKLTMDDRSTLSDYAEVFIRDLCTGKIYDISETPVYTFTENQANNNLRFRLYINPSGDIKNNITAGNAYTIYSANNMICIDKKTSKSQKGSLIIFDMFGNRVDELLLPDQENFCRAVGFPRGFYIARVVTTDFQIAEKIWIN